MDGGHVRPTPLVDPHGAVRRECDPGLGKSETAGVRQPAGGVHDGVGMECLARGEPHPDALNRPVRSRRAGGRDAGGSPSSRIRRPARRGHLHRSRATAVRPGKRGRPRTRSRERCWRTRPRCSRNRRSRSVRDVPAVPAPRWMSVQVRCREPGAGSASRRRRSGCARPSVPCHRPRRMGITYHAAAPVAVHSRHSRAAKRRSRAGGRVPGSWPRSWQPSRG